MFKLITSHGKLSSSKNLEKIKSAFSRNRELLFVIEAGKKKFGLFYCAEKKSVSNNLAGTTNSFIFEINSDDIKVFSQGNPK